MHRTKFIWKDSRPHKRNPEVTVKTGDWAQKTDIDLPDGRGVETRRITAYLEEGKIIYASLRRPDYDPCGRTDWLLDEEWVYE